MKDVIGITSWSTPGSRLAAAVTCGLALCVAMLLVALAQPRFQQSLSLRDGLVTVAGPGLDKAGISPGFGNSAITITVSDLTPEPDILGTHVAERNFMARQTRLAAALAGKANMSAIIPSGPRNMPAARDIRLVPDKTLPFEFWMQLGIGFAGFLVSAWIWSLAPRQLPNILFGLSGGCLLLSASAAAVYTTRWLAIDADMFGVLGELNTAGSIGFGIAMACLFFRYPVRLMSNMQLGLIAIFFGLWYLAGLLKLFPSPMMEGPLATAMEMALIVIGIAIQLYRSTGQPLERAAIRWVGVSMLFGGGLFICTAIVPPLLGLPPIVDQNYAFAFFLIIYVGVALGLRRERLFRSEGWAINLLVYAVAGLLLLAVDAVLIAILGSINKATVLTTLLLLPLVYLPWRSFIVRRFTHTTSLESLLEDVAHLSLVPDCAQRAGLWLDVLRRAFAPLEISELPPETARPDKVTIADLGVSLLIPATIGCPPVKLRHMHRGTRLFRVRDSRLASRMADFAQSLSDQRDSYESGVNAERARISRDLHDDLSAQLISGLTLSQPEKLKEVLRSSLAEVRTIVNARIGEAKPAGDVLADSRVEAADRLEAAGMSLDWPVREIDAVLTPRGHKALSSILRELTTNMIRHSSASAMTVQTRIENGHLYVIVADDGRGMSKNVEPGNGLKNIGQRLADVGGSVAYAHSPGEGFRASLCIPVPLS